MNMLQFTAPLKIILIPYILWTPQISHDKILINKNHWYICYKYNSSQETLIKD